MTISPAPYRIAAAFVARRPRVTALLAGLISATGFAPLGLWPVTVIMLALVMQLIWVAPDRKSAGQIGYLFGLGHFMLGLNWIAHAFTFQDSMPAWLGYPAVGLLSVYLAVYPAMAAMIGWTLGRGRPQVFALFLATAWLLTEYLRASLFTGFAWNPLGVIWLGTGVEQTAIAIGTYGLGLVAMLAAAALWWLAHRQWRPAGLMIVGLTLVAGLGLLRASYIGAKDQSGALANIHVVQPNINQNEKYDANLEILNFRRLAELTMLRSGKPALIFWPEAAVPAVLDMEPRWRGRIASLLGMDDLLMLGGDKYHFREQGGVVDTQVLEGANNSLWVLDARGDLHGRYDKAHLVPYGEYLPMRPVLEAIGLSRLVPGSVDFWPGPGPRTLDLPATPDGGQARGKLRMAVQICYEIIFSGQVVDRANRPDFLFNPSNDAWFGSWGPPQHLAQARLRAIEEGLSVIRSTPTGISALVDPAGRVVRSIPFQQAGAFEAPLPAPLPPTLFARLGNLLPVGLAVLLLASGVAIARRTR
ncbi:MULTISPECIES: apolipoprotein N-acyltransferase [unclassified Sphingobium]|uniref:apolipoprotein N-acyltransferase n=1 Tax=unclassified Sphingobium TaxID=2611147 RepID=UPI002224A12E|nr:MULTISPECIES: apolipoprotein N-acyltransferase [unclassified Sphingobium]MCW2393683.1 apolipoprotein N-acyltransferase [Sphingobium sp. B8D3B]MCW2417196.1 apolipoprotein N-acyltransferase [Sphingobium sp. B8D3C]